MKNIKIITPKGERIIGENQPCFIIAEMSGNHNQSYEKALKIIDAAIDSGADAIKLQTYTADTITIDCDNKYFQVYVNDDWKGQTLYSLYKKAYTPWEWQPKLKDYAEKKGVLVFSTPFDNTAVDFLENMNVQLYKVASFEVVDIPLLKRIGKTKKSVIMSRGMASIEEIELAIKTLKENGCPEIAILHCVSSYPATPEQMNLATITDIAKKFNVIAGLSDHTLGIESSITGVALGANIIEKHFTISRAEGGLDASFSLEPEEFKKMVKSIKETEKMIGKPTYTVGKKEAENIIFRKSLFVVKDIKEGDIFSNENIRSIRPGYGLTPKYYEQILKSTANCNIEKGTPLDFPMISDSPVLRPAINDDVKDIWRIRNNHAIRNKSRNQKKISLKNHKIWFRKRYIDNKDNICFVLANLQGIIGYCRLDLEPDKNYLISIAIDPSFQCKGMGGTLLKQTLKKVKTKKKISAEIQKKNILSLKLFKNNNFKIIKEDKNYYYLIYSDKNFIL